MPQVGPAMICASSITLIPFNGPIFEIPLMREVPIPLHYRGLEIQTSYRADFVVDQAVVIELKAVDRLLPIHSSQLLTYLRLLDLRVGLLINFNVTRLKFGVKRLVR